MNSLHPKKSLGQHWLFDVDSLNAMAEAAEVNSGDAVLEVGPGLGTLTEVLLNHGANVTAVEVDKDLAVMRHGVSAFRLLELVLYLNAPDLL